MSQRRGHGSLITPTGITTRFNQIVCQKIWTFYRFLLGIPRDSWDEKLNMNLLRSGPVSILSRSGSSRVPRWGHPGSRFARARSFARSLSTSSLRSNRQTVNRIGPRNRRAESSIRSEPPLNSVSTSSSPNSLSFCSEHSGVIAPVCLATESDLAAATVAPPPLLLPEAATLAEDGERLKAWEKQGTAFKPPDDRKRRWTKRIRQQSGTEEDGGNSEN